MGDSAELRIEFCRANLALQNYTLAARNFERARDFGYKASDSVKLELAEIYYILSERELMRNEYVAALRYAEKSLELRASCNRASVIQAAAIAYKAIDSKSDDGLITALTVICPQIDELDSKEERSSEEIKFLEMLKGIRETINKVIANKEIEKTSSVVDLSLEKKEKRLENIHKCLGAGHGEIAVVPTLETALLGTPIELQKKRSKGLKTTIEVLRKQFSGEADDAQKNRLRVDLCEKLLEKARKEYQKSNFKRAENCLTECISIVSDEVLKAEAQAFFAKIMLAQADGIHLVKRKMASASSTSDGVEDASKRPPASRLNFLSEFGFLDPFDAEVEKFEGEKPHRVSYKHGLIKLRSGEFGEASRAFEEAFIKNDENDIYNTCYIFTLACAKASAGDLFGALSEFDAAYDWLVRNTDKKSMIQCVAQNIEALKKIIYVHYAQLSATCLYTGDYSNFLKCRACVKAISGYMLDAGNDMYMASCFEGLVVFPEVIPVFVPVPVLPTEAAMHP